jgi:predicted transcriptional regulator
MTRPIKPEKCRALLRDYRQRRETTERQLSELRIELGTLAEQCREAGISITEISTIAGVTRKTVHDQMKATQQ